MSSINDTCKNWLDKQGSAFSESFKGLGSLAFKHLKQSPGYVASTAKVGLGLGVGAALGETGLRTANNWAHGDPSLGAPTSTQHALSSFYDSLGTGAHINPAIAAVSNKVLDSVDVNPKAQEFLSAAANITNPAVRKVLMGDVVNAAGQASGAVAENVGGTVGNALGQGVGHGMAAGFWENLKHNPIPTVTGAAAVSAGPLIAYDMLTKKRRQQEAKRNKAILRYILHHEKGGLQKSGNIAQSIESGVKGIASSPFFKKFVYRPTGIPADKGHIMDAYMAFKGHVPGKVADKLKEYPQTLFNNTVTRHPISTLVGGGAGVGFAQTMAESATKERANDYSTAGGAYGHMIKNMTAVPGSVVEGVEGGLMRSSALPRGDKSQSVAKINEIISNFTNPNKDYALPPVDPSYRPPHMQFSPEQLEQLRNADLGLGVDKGKPLGWGPYAALTGLFAAPAAAYGTYKHFANKKVDKAVDKADRMQNQLEHVNKLVET
jgi:hypothetical protein